MHIIQLDDQLYAKVNQFAIARGFKSVEAFIASVVEEDDDVDLENYDHLFTPKVMAGIDRGLEDVAAGRVHTFEESRKHFEEKSEAWRKKRTK